MSSSNGTVQSELVSPNNTIHRLPEQVPIEEYPDRVFVGGFPEDATEDDLSRFFEQYVQVREAKVLRYEEGKRGFGFLTLGNVKDATTLKNLSPDKLIFHGHRLNVGPARKRLHNGSQKRTYSLETQLYAVVTPEGLFNPGTFTFCVDKAPHFQLRTPPTKTQQTSPQHLVPSGQTSSTQTVPQVTVEQEFHLDEAGICETNNNSTHVLPQNIKPETMYPMNPMIPIVPIPFPLFAPPFQIPVQQNSGSPHVEFGSPVLPVSFLTSGDGPRAPFVDVRLFYQNGALHPHLMSQHFNQLLARQNEINRNHANYDENSLPNGEFYVPRHSRIDPRRGDFQAYSGGDHQRNRSPYHTDKRTSAKYGKYTPDHKEYPDLEVKMDQLLEQDDSDVFEN